MKLDLYITLCEALSYMHGTMKLHLWAWISITTNINYTNIMSKAEQKTFARCKTCYANLIEGTLHRRMWKNLQSPTVHLDDPKYWIAVRHYAHYRSTTNNKPTFFQRVVVIFDGKQSCKLCPIVLFGVLLFHINDTNSSHMHGRHPQSTKVTYS